jgi:hypothetical protein
LLLETNKSRGKAIGKYSMVLLELLNIFIHALLLFADQGVNILTDSSATCWRHQGLECLSLEDIFHYCCIDRACLRSPIDRELSLVKSGTMLVRVNNSSWLFVRDRVGDLLLSVGRFEDCRALRGY